MNSRGPERLCSPPVDALRRIATGRVEIKLSEIARSHWQRRSTLVVSTEETADRLVCRAVVSLMQRLPLIRDKIDAHDAIVTSMPGPRWNLPDDLHLTRLVTEIEQLYEHLVQYRHSTARDPENPLTEIRALMERLPFPPTAYLDWHYSQIGAVNSNPDVTVLDALSKWLHTLEKCHQLLCAWHVELSSNIPITGLAPQHGCQALGHCFHPTTQIVADHRLGRNSCTFAAHAAMCRLHSLLREHEQLSLSTFNLLNDLLPFPGDSVNCRHCGDAHWFWPIDTTHDKPRIATIAVPYRIAHVDC